MTTKRDLGDVSGEFFEESLYSTDNSTCLDTATEVVFSEEDGGMEEDEDITEGFVVGCCDGQIQTSDSEHSDDELYEICSLSDSISNWTIHLLAFLWLL